MTLYHISDIDSDRTELGGLPTIDPSELYSRDGDLDGFHVITPPYRQRDARTRLKNKAPDGKRDGTWLNEDSLSGEPLDPTLGSLLTRIMFATTRTLTARMVAAYLVHQWWELPEDDESGEVALSYGDIVSAIGPRFISRNTVIAVVKDFPPAAVERLSQGGPGHRKSVYRIDPLGLLGYFGQLPRPLRPGVSATEPLEVQRDRDAG